MATRLISAAVALALGCVGGNALALDISKHTRDSDTLNAIALSGDIKIGDLFQLQAYISQLPKKDRMAVYLSSNGGNLYEGMKLGRFFYKAKIQTVVEGKGAHCLSACALAFLGGRDAKSGLASRTKTTTGVLAFHSFAVTFDKDKQYTADDMSKIVQQTQNTVLDLANYLREVHTDLDFLRVMFRASSDKINIISNDEALSVGIRIWDEEKKRLVRPDVVMDRLKRQR